MAMRSTLGLTRFRKRRFGRSVGQLAAWLACLIVPALHFAAEPAPAAKPAYQHGSADEPLLAEFSLEKAAESLDRTAQAWVSKHKCGSCHTGWPYLMSRAKCKDVSAPALGEIRQFFEQRITNWDEDEQVKKHQH